MNPLLPIKTSEIIQLLGAIPHPEGVSQDVLPCPREVKLDMIPILNLS